MKETLTLIALIVISVSTIAQTDSTEIDTTTIYQQLDTLSFYNVGLRSETSNKSVKYWVNNKLVNQKTYKKYKSSYDNIDKCQPCYLKTYGEDDKLIREGVQFTDCAVGIWTEYYSNGKLKVIGHYKENDTGNWDDLWARRYCSRKEGLWTYYDEKGNVTKKEKYVDGKLIE